MSSSSRLRSWQTQDYLILLAAIQHEGGKKPETPEEWTKIQGCLQTCPLSSATLKRSSIKNLEWHYEKFMSQSLLPLATTLTLELGLQILYVKRYRELYRALQAHDKALREELRKLYPRAPIADESQEPPAEDPRLETFGDPIPLSRAMTNEALQESHPVVVDHDATPPLPSPAHLEPREANLEKVMNEKDDAVMEEETLEKMEDKLEREVPLLDEARTNVSILETVQATEINKIEEIEEAVADNKQDMQEPDIKVETAENQVVDGGVSTPALLDWAGRDDIEGLKSFLTAALGVSTVKEEAPVPLTKEVLTGEVMEVGVDVQEDPVEATSYEAFGQMEEDKEEPMEIDEGSGMEAEDAGPTLTTEVVGIEAEGAQDKTEEADEPMPQPPWPHPRAMTESPLSETQTPITMDLEPEFVHSALSSVSLNASLSNLSWSSLPTPTALPATTSATPVSHSTTSSATPASLSSNSLSTLSFLASAPSILSTSVPTAGALAGSPLRSSRLPLAGVPPPLTMPPPMSGSTPGSYLPPPHTPETPTFPPAPIGSDPVSEDDMTPQKHQRAWRRLALHKWDDIANTRRGNPFLNLVARRGHEAYTRAVRAPMDLKRIRQRVREIKVCSTESFHRDLYLMLANTCMFHPPDSDVHQMALEMKLDIDLHMKDFKSVEQAAAMKLARAQPGANAAGGVTSPKS